MSSFEQLFDAYVLDVQTAANEDSLKKPLQNLIEGFAEALGLPISSGTEDTEAVVGSRPDVNLYDMAGERMWLGAVELKSPKKALPGRRGYTKDAPGMVGRWNHDEELIEKAAAPAKHDTEQWANLSQLPNMLYANGLMMARYESGRLVDCTDKDALHYGDDEPEKTNAGVSIETIRDDFERMLRDALQWEPSPPSNTRQMARSLAPLARKLKEDILDALKKGNATITQTKKLWTSQLISGATNDDFADAYSQASVFALLFARLDGAELPLTLDSVKAKLKDEHSLLLAVIDGVLRSATRDVVRNSLDAIIRYVSVVDAEAIRESGDNPWHDFYEFFVAEYDPERRNDTGVYFTPKPIVDFQVAQIHEWLLDNGFSDSFATKGVTVVDPATGSGTYLLAVIERTRSFLEERGRAGIDDAPDWADSLAANIHGIEIGIGAYSIAQLRIGRALADMKGTGDAPHVNVYLADTLTNPWGDDQQQFFLAELADEQERANNLKASPDVTVVVGNPPYDRQEKAEGEERRELGGWVRLEPRTAQAGGDVEKPLLDDFRDRAIERKHGKQASKAIPNLYICFWRWAIWKALEQNDGPGIVSFISPIAFLTGVGTEAMRAWMREQADEIVTYDLIGERRGERRTYNVFSEIKTTTGITVATREQSESEPTSPAPWHRITVEGTPKERLAQLDEWAKSGTPTLDPIDPAELFDDVVALEDAAPLADHIPLTDLFPFHRKGVQAQRMWPYAESRDLAERRWATLLASTDKAASLGENRTNTITDVKESLFGAGPLTPLNELAPDAEPERIAVSQYRPFDTHHVVADPRAIGFPSRDLWATAAAPLQRYLVSRFAKEGSGYGPISIMTPYVPDLDCANGASGGGADVAPAFRDPEGQHHNCNTDLVAFLRKEYNNEVSALDLAFYCNGLLGTSAYANRFWKALGQVVPRIAFPTDHRTFEEIISLGQHLAWLQTGGELGRPLDGFDFDDHPIRSEAPAERESGGMPAGWSWDPDTGAIEVDKRIRIAGVPSHVWDLQILGKRPLESWLNYRKAKRKQGGRANVTPLDDLRPDWGPEMSGELLDIATRLFHLEEAAKIAAPLIATTFDNPLIVEYKQPSSADRKPVLPDDREESQLSLAT